MRMVLRDSARPSERVGILNLWTAQLLEDEKDVKKGAYDSWKAATSSKTSGKMKLRSDQSSAKLFYKDSETAYNKNIIDHTYVQRGTRQEHPPCAGVLFDFLHENRVHVFQTVALINYDLTPVILGKVHSVFDDHLVSCNDDGKGRQLGGWVRTVFVWYNRLNA